MKTCFLYINAGESFVCDILYEIQLHILDLYVTKKNLAVVGASNNLEKMDLPRSSSLDVLCVKVRLAKPDIVLVIDLASLSTDINELVATIRRLNEYGAKVVELQSSKKLPINTKDLAAQYQLDIETAS